ncbi:hypothetical protein HK099_000672 [Clydaea vesicula]|uniref:Zn(2)-C6 fungal-type domain-containing protein n=1 Tax=Clydaea vesicula TaxID=447962 RepID=A0AAD5XSR1_9FUNG|nr:hypothetical protein HK099_000672 [Clydaea vesicula]KAJ3379721.1 hypothetical protein HDU92_006478 [Lobulomyces angularis]
MNQGKYSNKKATASSHVSKSCTNCKKAHLKCDNQRPCFRCTKTGNCETCVDTVHKRRGRPHKKPYTKNITINEQDFSSTSSESSSADERNFRKKEKELIPKSPPLTPITENIPSLRRFQFAGQSLETIGRSLQFEKLTLPPLRNNLAFEEIKIKKIEKPWYSNWN